MWVFRQCFQAFIFHFFIVHLFYSSLRDQRFQNARKYGKATWVHDGSSRGRGSRRWKAKSKYFADNTNHSFMFLIPRKYSFTQHANNVNICFSIPWSLPWFPGQALCKSLTIHSLSICRTAEVPQPHNPAASRTLLGNQPLMGEVPILNWWFHELKSSLGVISSQRMATIPTKR